MRGKILVLHGPNLNLLGTREPEKYGHVTLEAINHQLVAQAKADGVELNCFQSNAEHLLIEQIHQAKSDGVDFIIINTAAFTHTSVALRDAFLGVAIPFIEVHLSNIHAREPFRHHSYLSDISLGVICGLKDKGYQYALSHALSYLKSDIESHGH